MGTGGSAAQNDIELLTMPHQSRQLGSRRHNGHPPPPRLLTERQFKTIAPQSALVDDREMAANCTDISGIQTCRKTRLGFNELIAHGRNPRIQDLCALYARE